LDRPRNRRPISRRLNTLRHSTAVNQTWNYCHSISFLLKSDMNKMRTVYCFAGRPLTLFRWYFQFHGDSDFRFVARSGRADIRLHALTGRATYPWLDQNIRSGATRVQPGSASSL
jgi:hypothetical protein